MRRIYIVCGLAFAGLVLAGLFIGTPLASADATVGHGHPQDCTEQALDDALTHGGLITFNCGPAPITLTVHEKVISSSLTINGGGLVTLSGDNLNRVFSITVGGNLFLQNLRITKGFSTQLFSGGAIFNAGGLNLSHSQVDNSLCFSPCIGAAIANVGTLYMTDSTIRDNQMDVAGAVTNFGSGTVAIFSSTISFNSSLNAASPGGAGLSNRSNTVSLLRDSSVISNSSASDGGGIYNANLATLLIVNSTVSGNSAEADGGGLKNQGTMRLYNATVTNNYADNNLDGIGVGGGISNTGTFEFRNTVLAGNYESFFSISFGWVAHQRDCAGTLQSDGYNLVENYNTTICFFTGAPITLTDPLLGPLEFNGGPTLTHLPLAGSPAINAGNPAGCIDNAALPLTNDQRGYRRFGVCDIGAAERSFELDLPLVRR